MMNREDQSDPILSDLFKVAEELSPKQARQTYYDILGVPFGVDIDRIKDSYRLFPEKKKTVITDEAYKVLTTPALRQEYEAELNQRKPYSARRYLDPQGYERWDWSDNPNPAEKLGPETQSQPSEKERGKRQEDQEGYRLCYATGCGKPARFSWNDVNAIRGEPLTSYWRNDVMCAESYEMWRRLAGTCAIKGCGKPASKHLGLRNINYEIVGTLSPEHEHPVCAKHYDAIIEKRQEDYRKSPQWGWDQRERNFAFIPIIDECVIEFGRGTVDEEFRDEEQYDGPFTLFAVYRIASIRDQRNRENAYGAYYLWGKDDLDFWREIGDPNQSTQKRLRSALVKYQAKLQPEGHVPGGGPAPLDSDWETRPWFSPPES